MFFYLGFFLKEKNKDGLGTGTPKDRDEFNRREVCDCEVCVLEVVGDPSRLRLIRKCSLGEGDTYLRFEL